MLIKLFFSTSHYSFSCLVDVKWIVSIQSQSISVSAVLAVLEAYACTVIICGWGGQTNDAWNFSRVQNAPNTVRSRSTLNLAESIIHTITIRITNLVKVFSFQRDYSIQQKHKFNESFFSLFIFLNFNLNNKNTFRR